MNFLRKTYFLPVLFAFAALALFLLNSEKVSNSEALEMQNFHKKMKKRFSNSKRFLPKKVLREKRKIASIEDQIKKIDPSKRTICAITINSVDEKEVFSNRLPNFNVVEIADSSYQEDEKDNGRWMDDACESDLKCDILVVSGHFGGSFFGDSGFRLSTEKMEELMCKKSCEGVFNHPKEVFLFGCNTLAGKALDHRSPEEYIEVLVEDGFSVIEAQEVAAFRYSPVGNSFHDRMTRVFSSVPKIYGFDSVGPSGRNVRHMLEKYFDYIPNYEQHLQSVSPQADNQHWSKALKVTTQNQSAGVLNQDEVLNDKICLINNDDIGLHEKWKVLSEAFTDEETLLRQLPALLKLVNDVEEEWRYEEEIRKRRPELAKEEKRYKSNIATNEVVKSVFKKYLEKYIPGMLGIRASIYQVAEHLEVFPRPELNEYRGNLIGNVKDGINRERAEVICSYDNLTIPTLTLQDLPSGSWDIYETWAVICLGVTDTAVQEKVFFENYENDLGMATELLDNGYVNVRILEKLVEKFAYYQARFPSGDDWDTYSDDDWDNYDNYSDLIKAFGMFRGGKSSLLENLMFNNELWGKNNINDRHLVAIARYVHQRQSFDDSIVRKILSMMYPEDADGVYSGRRVEDANGRVTIHGNGSSTRARAVLRNVFLQNKLCQYIPLAEEYEANIAKDRASFGYSELRGSGYSLEPEKEADRGSSSGSTTYSGVPIDRIKISNNLKAICN